MVGKEIRGETVWYVVLLWAIGAGKTTCNAIFQWLQWFYLTTHWFEFRKELNILSAGYVALIQMNKDETKAKEVTFGKIKPLFECGFNKDYFPIDSKLKTKILIPRNNTMIFPGTGSAASALGYDIYASGLDEMAKMDIIEHSKRGNTGGDQYDVGKDMFDQIDQRISSRFSDATRGTMVMFTQRNTGREFIEKFANDIESGVIKNGIVKRYAFWEAVGRRNRKFFPTDDAVYFNIKNFNIITDKEEVDKLILRKVDGKKNSNIHSCT